MIKVSVALNLTVQAGPRCVASGATVRPQTSPMETLMLAGAPHQGTAPPGLPRAQNLDIAELMEEAEVGVDEAEVEEAEVEEAEVEVEEAVVTHVEAEEDLVEVAGALMEEVVEEAMVEVVEV